MSLDKSKLKIKVGGDFEALPADKYTAQVSDVSLVTQFNKFKGIEEDLLNFKFTILDDKETESGESTRGRLVWQRVSQTLGGRSKLGKLAIAIYGRELTKDEMETFDPESLLGKQVDIMVVQNPSSDGTTIYNNIISVSKAIKKLKPVEDQEQAKPLVKKTVPATAPDAEDPEEFINKLEQDKRSKSPAPEEPGAEEEDADVEALEAEQRAAEAALKIARAKQAAKAKAKQ